MTKNLCGPLTQLELTKRPATANRFVTPALKNNLMLFVVVCLLFNFIFWLLFLSFFIAHWLAIP